MPNFAEINRRRCRKPRFGIVSFPEAQRQHGQRKSIVEIAQVLRSVATGLRRPGGDARGGARMIQSHRWLVARSAGARILPRLGAINPKRFAVCLERACRIFAARRLVVLLAGKEGIGSSDRERLLRAQRGAPLRWPSRRTSRTGPRAGGGALQTDESPPEATF